VQVVLVEPEIPQNTGSVARLCAATATRLHLVGRLDYWPLVDLRVHASWSDFAAAMGPGRLLAFSSHGTHSYTRVAYDDADCLVFGGESRGLPAGLRDHLAPLYRIPLAQPAVRSLNLANAVSIVLYEGLRQLGRV
jgi:tRNA (cytidine/uridine-2'-O-)-methyltransferase